MTLKLNDDALTNFYCYAHEETNCEFCIDEVKKAIQAGIEAERKNWKDICEKCRGKGYRTEMSGLHGASDIFIGEKGFNIAPHNHMVYCSCERGEQLEKAIESL